MAGGVGGGLFLTPQGGFWRFFSGLLGGYMWVYVRSSAFKWAYMRVYRLCWLFMRVYMFSTVFHYFPPRSYTKYVLFHPGWWKNSIGSASFHHRLIRIQIQLQPEGAFIATLANLRQPCRRRRGRAHHHQHREDEQPATTRERSAFDPWGYNSQLTF